MGGGVFDLFKIPFYWMFWNEIVFAETSGNYASIFDVLPNTAIITDIQSSHELSPL